MTIKNGSILQINKVDYGEKVGSTKDHYEVYYIRPDPSDPVYFKHDETYELVPKDQVTRSVRTRGSYEDSWDKMGFIKKSCGRFIKIGEPNEIEDDSDEISSTDTWSTDEDESDLSDFICDDEEFDENRDDEKKKLEEDFENWVPRTSFQKKMKQTIENIEYREKVRKDNLNF